MVIIVTTEAFGTEPQVTVVFLITCFITGDEFRLMAILAFFFSMGTLQRITREVMIELILIKTDQVELSSMMIAVAFEAIFSFYLVRHMISLIQINPRFKQFMTFKTFIIGHFITQDMTFCAVGQPFEVSMWFGQFSG